MTGDLLARELISIRPATPIIVCTGYSDRIDTDLANEIGIRELVMKPVVMKDIKQEFLEKWLPLPHGVPSKDVFRRVLMALQPEAFQTCFGNWLTALISNIRPDYAFIGTPAPNTQIGLTN